MKMKSQTFESKGKKGRVELAAASAPAISQHNAS